MTSRQILHRGYNLMVVAFLFFIGLSMAMDAVPETEFADKIDDLGLLLVGLIAVAWYLTRGRNRSVVPVALSVLALAVQTLGLFLEFGDKASFGDNIGGIVALAPFTIFVIWQYVRQPAIIDAAPASAIPEPAVGHTTH